MTRTYDDAKQVADLRFSLVAWRVVGLVVLLLYVVACARIVTLRRERDALARVVCAGTPATRATRELCGQLRDDGWTP